MTGVQTCALPISYKTPYPTIIFPKVSLYFFLDFLFENANTKVIGPTLPKYMVIVIIILLIFFKLDVISLVKPTVDKPETV